MTLAALAGCSSAGADPRSSSYPGTRLGISNTTTLPVTLVVNGASVGTFQAGTQADVFGSGVAVPALPWAVEARSPSGRVLISLDGERGGCLDDD